MKRKVKSMLSGLKSVLDTIERHPLFPLIYVVLLFLLLLWLYRRFSILKTGGRFWDRFHIMENTLYVHAGFFFRGRRDVPFSEIRRVHIYYTRGRWCGSYTLQLYREKGPYQFLVLPGDKKGEKQLKELERIFFQHRIPVTKKGP